MIYADPKSLPPIISIDVSKGKANAIEVLYPTDLDGKKKLTVHVFSYDKDGLGELSTMYDDVMRIRNDGVAPVIVMEHTGIYTAPIIRYCEKHGYDFVMLHPSMSNEARRNVSVKAAKNDNLDCRYIAICFYDHYGSVNKRVLPYRREMHAVQALKSFHVHMLARQKQFFMHYLDLVFPLIDKTRSLHLYTREFLSLIKRYPHPETLPSEKEMVKFFMNLKRHRIDFCEQMAREIEEYKKTCFSGVEPGSEETVALSETAKDLMEKIERVEGLSKKLDSMARKNGNYNRLLTIPGVGPKIASAILSEIGDLNSFPSGDKLASFVGIVHQTKQSGTSYGLHSPISKKGNPRVRVMMFLAAKCALYCREDNMFKRFYSRLTQTNEKRAVLSPKQALIAVAHKILLVMRALVVDQTDFKSD